MLRRVHIPLSPLLLFAALALHAHITTAQPLDLYKHVYWQAWGQNRQEWSYFGLNYLGKLNDSVEHAIVVADRFGAHLCLNRWPLDTASKFTFPGFEVVPAHFSDNPFQDYLVFGLDIHHGKDLGPYQRIMHATHRLDSAVAGLSFPVDNLHGLQGEASGHTLAVTDVDSSGYDDIVFSNADYEDSLGHKVGALFLVRGGPGMDSIPDDSLIGVDEWRGHVGGVIYVGKFRDTSRRFLAEVRGNAPPSASYKNDTIRVYLYPLGPQFRLVPTDTLFFVIDTLKYDFARSPYWVHAMDISGDGIDDILVASFDEIEYQANGGGGLVLGYACGQHPQPEPTHLFHGPPGIGAGSFGQHITDVGHASSTKYRSILISAETASNVSLREGAVFLYNVGSGYRDTCVAWARGLGQPESFYGHTTMAIGDVNHDSLDDFAVGSDEWAPLTSDDFNGHLALFLGDESYATPPSAVADPPVPPLNATLRIFPNPARDIAWIDYAFPSEQHHGTMEVVDVLGNVVRRVPLSSWRGTARIDMRALPAGVYFVHVNGSASEHNARGVLIKRD